MISAILSLLGSSAIGSMIGGLFAWLNRKQDLEVKKLELEQEGRRWQHELALRQADLEQVKAEAAGRAQVAVIEGEASIETARMQAIGATNAADQLNGEDLEKAGWWRWLLVMVEALRRSIRPMLTIALTVSAMVTIFMMNDRFMNVGWAELTKDQKFDMIMQGINWLTAQASAAISFWFVSRGSVGIQVRK